MLHGQKWKNVQHSECVELMAESAVSSFVVLHSLLFSHPNVVVLFANLCNTPDGIRLQIEKAYVHTAIFGVYWVGEICL